MSKHTPGPWTVASEIVNDIDIDTERTVPRALRRIRDANHEIVMADDHGIANHPDDILHLVAAAPEMLALLKRASVRLMELGANEDNDGLMDAISAAIIAAGGAE